MAQKRMFDKAILDTDKFMDLPLSGKALYFLLGMEADDEGFISPKKVLRIHGGNEDDIKILIAKNFLIPFKSGVVVITDWKKNNWLDSRRIKPTEYQIEKKLLFIKNTNEYALLSNRLASASPEESRIEENRIEENILPNGHSAENSHKEIVEVIEAFKEINPSYRQFFGNKTQRGAAERLLKEFGSLEKTKEKIGWLKQTNQMPYAPVITTPKQFEDKRGALIAFINKERNKK